MLNVNPERPLFRRIYLFNYDIVLSGRNSIRSAIIIILLSVTVD